ncbi:hypothetical protein KZX46_22490 (plasmid) [Polymorphobacter sp. PAMC 29334]|uniref:hypothetical protein n=1 Tax=Polymorphobacter sp. PAMC 29334 TaxID=2862331 RepID=UPI001C748F21|nr:hypothetical protein [Polymorphobacter sp. PAMC 29334]QYE37152.1 hypothetical protein KZX46_22490 [Polymorphobacter sp. PAMC 29334]
MAVGPIGLIPSTPLTLCLVVLGRHVRHLEFLDVLLRVQPAPTPLESFYQRILANDADEVRDHAEGLLKERSLSSYYDDVALKGLQLAAVDAQRGNLHPDQLASIRTTIVEVIDGLKDHPDTQPAAAASESAVIAPSQRGAGTVPATPAIADVEDGEALPPEWGAGRGRSPRRWSWPAR